MQNNAKSLAYPWKKDWNKSEAKQSKTKPDNKGKHNNHNQNNNKR